MKRIKLTMIATLIAAFVISMFAFQPTNTEASNNAAPSATPSPRTIKRQRKSPALTGDHPEMRRTNSRKRRTGKKTNTRFYVPNADAEQMQKPKTTKSSKNEVSIETLERKKQPRKRSTGKRMHKP